MIYAHDIRNIIMSGKTSTKAGSGGHLAQQEIGQSEQMEVQGAPTGSAPVVQQQPTPMTVAATWNLRRREVWQQLMCMLAGCKLVTVHALGQGMMSVVLRCRLARPHMKAM